MHKIWFNGEGYPDADAMPPDVRRLYEAAIERRAWAETSPASEVVRMGMWEDDGDGKLEVHTSREIVINGKKYSDLDGGGLGSILETRRAHRTHSPARGRGRAGDTLCLSDSPMVLYSGCTERYAAHRLHELIHVKSFGRV